MYHSIHPLNFAHYCLTVDNTPETSPLGSGKERRYYHYNKFIAKVIPAALMGKYIVTKEVVEKKHSPLIFNLKVLSMTLMTFCCVCVPGVTEVHVENTLSIDKLVTSCVWSQISPYRTKCARNYHAWDDLFRWNVGYKRTEASVFVWKALMIFPSPVNVLGLL